jgi:hypothetical protein
MENSYVKLLVELAEAGVDFATVGGLACAMNGHVRMTEDVDILVRRTDKNLRLLLDTLSGIGEGYAKELTISDFPDEEGAVRVIEDFPIDIFVRMSGNTLENLQSHIRRMSIGQTAIPYLDAAGLLLLKTGSLRQKDKLDVLALRRLSGQ